METVQPVKRQKSLLAFVEKDGKTENGEDFRKPLVDCLTDSEWKNALKEEMEKAYFVDIQRHLDGEEMKAKEVFPPRSLIFNALNLTPLSNVKVVILGQDPYHDNGQVRVSCA